MIRVLTTIVLAAAVLAGIWYLPVFYFKLAILFITALGLLEYVKLVLKDNSTRIFTFVLGMGVTALYHFAPKPEIFGVFLAAVFLCFVWCLKFHEPLKGAVHQAALMVLGIVYLGMTLPFWSAIREIGREWVMLLLVPTLLSDTFGFLVGKMFGRNKLAPIISPNKTYEGLVGSIFGGGIFGFWLALQLFFKDKLFVEWPMLITIGVSISLIAVFGDLIESLIKRSVGAKDSSHLIPGHGGALDRLDALIFTAPFFYLVVLRWVYS